MVDLKYINYYSNPQWNSFGLLTGAFRDKKKAKLPLELNKIALIGKIKIMAKHKFNQTDSNWDWRVKTTFLNLDTLKIKRNQINITLLTSYGDQSTGWKADKL